MICYIPSNPVKPTADASLKALSLKYEASSLASKHDSPPELGPHSLTGTFSGYIHICT